MDRKIFINDKILSLAEYIKADDIDFYNNWMDVETQNGYNFKQYRNRGYGTQAFLLGIRYCFEELKLDKIYAGCYPHNKTSYKMLMKCGFTPNPSGNIEEKHYLTGEPLTQFDYVLYNPILIL